MLIINLAILPPILQGEISRNPWLCNDFYSVRSIYSKVQFLQYLGTFMMSICMPLIGMWLVKVFKVFIFGWVKLIEVSE
jgi:hypothetical protein